MHSSLRLPSSYYNKDDFIKCANDSILNPNDPYKQFSLNKKEFADGAWMFHTIKDETIAVIIDSKSAMLNEIEYNENDNNINNNLQTNETNDEDNNWLVKKLNNDATEVFGEKLEDIYKFGK